MNNIVELDHIFLSEWIDTYNILIVVEPSPLEIAKDQPPPRWSFLVEEIVRVGGVQEDDNDGGSGGLRNRTIQYSCYTAVTNIIVAVGGTTRTGIIIIIMTTMMMHVRWKQQ
jgi:hypothetical protein